MKAIHIHRYGEPDMLTYEDASRPEPAEDKLLIRVYATGVNSIDCKLCAGIARWLPNP